MPIEGTCFVTRHVWRLFTGLVPSKGGLVPSKGGLVLRDGVGTKLDSLVGVGFFGGREWLFVDCRNEGC